MIAFVRKNLTFLILEHTSSPVCRSPFSFSPSLHFFSTSRGTQLGINLAVFDILVHKYEFPTELASRVASELTRLENPEKADSILSFFKECGCSNTQLEKIVKNSRVILAASLENIIKPKIKLFQEVGFSSDDICKIISVAPTILRLSVKNNIIPSLSVLKGLLGSDNDAARVITRSPRLLTMNLKNNVVPNVEFLKSSGMPLERIRTIFRGYPNTFLLKPEVIRKSAKKAEEMGLDASSIMFPYAILTIASMRNEAWELKLQGFRNLGFSDGEILTMFRKEPRVYSGSMEKIKKIKELLLATGKFNMSSIVDNPLSLGFSIEKRYKPRLQILRILESRELIKGWPNLRTIYYLSDDKFYEKFIRPYLDEISDVYIADSSAEAKRR